MARVLLVFLFSFTALADPRRVPFWPDEVPAAIQKHVDGAAVLDAVRALAKNHRVQGSPGYRAAADWMVGELKTAGFADAKLEPLPADGKTKYAHFPSYFGWRPSEGKLEEVAPSAKLIADFATLPVALADYSQDADVTAELVDVGKGTEPADYQGKDVRGKLVLAEGSLPEVHKLAVEERGAVGFVSVYPNQKTAWSGLDADLIRWGHLSPYQTQNRFAFMVSPRQASAFRAELSRGPVRLRAHVRAKMAPASFDVVSATIPGKEAGEIVLTAHLCHQSPGANDNASGSAALLGAARALQAAVAAGELPRPTRTLRFLWLPEIAGSQAWLVTHPDLAARLRAGVHLDMVGGRPDATHAALHLSRSASTLPHIADEIAAAWVADVARASTRYAESGEGDGIVSPAGTSDALVTDLRPVELGSDHQVFEAFGIPMIYFHDWPDVTIHTNKDVPENLDATKLGRVSYMSAGIAWTLAALPDAEAGKLVALERTATDERIAEARHRAVAEGWSAADAALAEREAIAVGQTTLATLAAMWPSTKAEATRVADAFPKVTARGDGKRDERVPLRSPEVRGELDVYYYSAVRAQAPIQARQGGVLAWETLNLVDGRRSVGDIRDVLSGRYAPVPIEEVSGYLDLLAKAGVVTFRQ